MAPKRRSQKHEPPVASPEEEEKISAAEESDPQEESEHSQEPEEDSEESDSPKAPVTKKEAPSKKPKTATATSKRPSSSTEPGSKRPSSTTEPGSEEDVVVKSKASKTMKEQPEPLKTKKPTSKPSVAAATAAPAVGSKRASASEPKESKRAKKKAADSESDQVDATTTLAVGSKLASVSELKEPKKVKKKSADLESDKENPTATTAAGSKRASVSEPKESKRAKKKAADSESDHVDAATTTAGGSKRASVSEAKKAKKKAADSETNKEDAIATPAGGLKRASVSEAKKPKESKRDKKKGADLEMDQEYEDRVVEVRPLFKRIWSDEDEIIILKGMADYWEKKGRDPYADMNAFHSHIKESLTIDATKNQLQDKIRRLRVKHENHVEKGKYNPTKVHDQKVFALSKKVWVKRVEEGEGDGEEEGLRKVARVARRKVPLGSQKAQVLGSELPKKAVKGACLKALRRSFRELGFPESIVNASLENLEESELEELKVKWKELQTAKLKVYIKGTEFKKFQINLIRGGFNSQ